MNCQKSVESDALAAVCGMRRLFGALVKNLVEK